MKTLVLIIMFMSLPLIGQAKSWKHNNHYDKHHEYSSFWEQVERRQYRQHKRIDRGIDSGQLTRREVKKLKRENRYISKQIKYIKRHRHLSYEDKKCVNEYLNNYSNKIRRYKHNDHYAYRYRDNKHSYHNHQYDRNYKKERQYNKDRKFSWANNDYSGGLYFRF